MFATIMDRETSSQGGSLWYPSHVMIYILDYWIAMSIYNPFLRPDLIQKIYACVVSTCDKWSYHRLKNLTMNYLPPSVQWSTKRLQKPTMNNLPSVSEWSTKDFRISYISPNISTLFNESSTNGIHPTEWIVTHQQEYM